MGPNIVELHAVIRGRVQGVGFRASARLHAVKLGLKGYAKNRPDGTVEIVAIGKQSELDRLLTILKDEEFKSHIQSVDVHYRSPSQEYRDFLIL